MEDLSEKEQLEHMRAWWSEYGNYVVGGIVVGIAIIVGLSQYRSRVETTQVEASALYDEVYSAVMDGNLDDAEAAATTLFADYASTVYPSQARLAMARLYMDNGRDEDAANALRSVVADQPTSEIGHVARIRLAKVLAYQDKAQEVVDLLSNAPASAMQQRYSEALGDAFVELGDFDRARSAYLDAMADNADRPTIDRALLQMKIDDLPRPSAVADAPVNEETATE